MKRILAVLVLILAPLVASGTATAQDLLITNARVIVGNGRVLDNAAILVRAGRIVSVGAAPASVPPATTRIDARGMTAMPGFIDAHRHVIGGNTQQWLANQATPRLQEFLEAGYTTLMSGGGPVPGIDTLKDRIEKGELKGPRIITSGRIATTGNDRTREKIGAEAKALADARIEIIKVNISPEATPQEVAALALIVEEGKKHNLMTMVHAVSNKAMMAAVQVGVQKLVHTPHFGWTTDAEAKAVAAAGVEQLSTIAFGTPVFGVFNQDNVPTFRDGKPWPEAIIDGEGRGREAGYKAVNARTLWDNGVVYGFGTDTGYHPRAGLVQELKALALMFSMPDIVKMMGPNTAAFIEKTADLGTLETGKLADIVLFTGNPMDGFWHMLDPRLVIKGGAVMVDKR